LDEQNSTSYVTGAGGEIEGFYEYDAFGAKRRKSEEIKNRILYTGQQYDQETGQYYLRARFYNPVVGRFFQEDVYRGDGLNLYAYCGNNPVNYYDPSGYNKKTPNSQTCKDDVETTTKGSGDRSGTDGSFRNGMTSKDLEGYEKYWRGVAEKTSNNALDMDIAKMNSGNIKKPNGDAFSSTKISAAVDMNTGDIYLGYSGKKGYNPSKPDYMNGEIIEPSLQARINNTKDISASDLNNPYREKSSYEPWAVDNCAEVYATNKALQNSADIDNIFLNTKTVKTGEYDTPCDNCKITFNGFLMPNGE
jgi:RHS repeat-associated protein